MGIHEILLLPIVTQVKENQQQQQQQQQQ